MKISKKIMFSNLIIGFLVTFLLSIMILVVANNFIRDNSYYNMEKEVDRLADAFAYRGLDNLINGNISQPGPDMKKNIPIGHVFIILDSEGNLLAHTDYTYDDEASDAFYEDLYKSNSDQFVNLQLGKYPVVTYKKTISYENEQGASDIEIIGLVYNSLLYKLLFQLMVPVIIALFIVVILSFILSSIYGKKITEPVESLITMTRKISKKEIVKSSINSHDEFEVISDALEEMSLALNIKDLESKQFYEYVSHDLKTPLTIISGYAEGINNGIFENNKDPLDKIVKHCDLLKHQIEDLIYLSQLETDKQVFEFRPLIIEDIISDILDDFEVVFTNSDIEIIYQPNKKTTIDLDKDKTTKAISNIILNASRFTESVIEITIHENENSTQVVISDNGPGFNEQVLSHPFKGYFEKSESGNGIGLMIVNKIMEAQGGSVKIYNNDQGAVVELLFNN